MSDRLNDQQLDDLIRGELLSVSGPAELRQKLLNPELLAATHGALPTLPAANDSWYRRALPVAACLVAALGLAFWSSGRHHSALADEVFAHIYFEEGQLENADAETLSLAAVNDRLQQSMGAHLEMSEATAEQMQVTFAKDCWVAQQVAFHMVMKGEAGPVTVMMIPSTERDAEFDISDDRYAGLVSPTTGGYLVVVGDRQEPIAEYRNLLRGSLEWEY